MDDQNTNVNPNTGANQNDPSPDDLIMSDNLASDVIDFDEVVEDAKVATTSGQVNSEDQVQQSDAIDERMSQDDSSSLGRLNDQMSGDSNQSDLSMQDTQDEIPSYDLNAMPDDELKPDNQLDAQDNLSQVPSDAGSSFSAGASPNPMQQNPAMGQVGPQNTAPNMEGANPLNPASPLSQANQGSPVNATDPLGAANASSMSNPTNAQPMKGTPYQQPQQSQQPPVMPMGGQPVQNPAQVNQPMQQNPQMNSMGGLNGMEEKDQNVYNFLISIIKEKRGEDYPNDQMTAEADKLYDELGDLLVNTFEPEMQDNQKKEFDELVSQGYAQDDLQTYLLQNIPSLEQRIQQILIDFRQKYLAS